LEITPNLFAVFMLENAKNHLLDRDSKDSGWWVLESAQWAIAWQLKDDEAKTANTLIKLSSIRRSMRLKPTEKSFPSALLKETNEKTD